MATPSYPLRRKSPRPFASRLVIMVKEPVAGRVKTRLGRGIGTVGATAIYRAMLSTLVARLGNDRRWETFLAVSPDAACVSHMFPVGTLRVPQGSGDLGRRMQSLFDGLPPGPVVIIGSDIPAIDPEDIATAFRELGRNNAVFGPSSDGGYWLIGLKRLPRIPRAFAHVRWSSENALVDTKLHLAGLRIAHLRVLDDVDTIEDLKLQRPLVGRRVMPPTQC